MPAQLVALTDGPNILLDKPILLLGRHGECDIQLNSRKVSRRHCCIAQVNTYLVVRDLGSTNGIRINGVRVLEGRLKSGDELTVGNFRYQVSWDENGQAVAMVQTNRVLEQPHQNPAPEGRMPVRAVPFVPTDPEEDQILESCDDPVMLGQPKKSKPGTKPADSSPHFPDNVNLLADSNLGMSPPAPDPSP